ncbi:cyclin-I [Rhincodon typus]|uniref:cyclin-I n=1 Tax=Rhincodon typus TaxID=259920 RepID=UPI0009A40860|nr:cyclin-I [Rhincodon typus]XP_048448246.1 cyclin-I [Rhincodon typus]XP_048448308.1 cyclin-I [Rhincodon typus]
MKFSGPLESQRLSVLLENAVSREVQMWKVYVPKYLSNPDTDVSPAQRDEVIQWLADLNRKFHFYPETLSLAITILDRFLALVKARPKYLWCIAISCFFLAAKTNEEDEIIPSLKDMVKTSNCGCSSADILRMERIVLDKLNWDLHTATPLDFLHIFHAMTISSRPQLLSNLPKMTPSQHIALLIRQLQHCVACHQLLQFKGSTLALAIISLKLETSIPDWLAVTIDLLKKAQLDSLQLIRCRELVAGHLSTFRASLPSNEVYIYNPGKQTMVLCGRGALKLYSSPTTEPEFVVKDATKRISSTAAPCHRLPDSYSCKQASAKRKVEDMEMDDFYDGIKRLYNEECSQEIVGIDTVSSSCSTNLQIKDGSISPCPPLQPVTVI